MAAESSADDGAAVVRTALDYFEDGSTATPHAMIPESHQASARHCRRPRGPARLTGTGTKPDREGGP